MPKRVLLAGLFHETHTFLDGVTRLADFESREGEQMLAAEGDGSPLSGALAIARERKWALRPSIDLRANPSATVEDAVFEYFWQHVHQAIDRQGTLDGIFLVLHGAMVCQTIRDVEGELVRRLRKHSRASRVPICGVLDLHGNISRDTVERTNGLIAYRTCPHIDARQAAVDAALLLDRILATDIAPAGVYEDCPLMWPPTGTATADDPMRTLEQLARDIEREEEKILAVNVMAGFSFADVPETGLSLSAVTLGDPSAARAPLRRLAVEAIRLREAGNVIERPLVEQMPDILNCVARGRTPVAIVEPADNIGGGAPGDSTALLRVLLEHRVERAAVVINDPAAVEELAATPVGTERMLRIGGKGSSLSEPPLEGVFELLSRSNGKFQLEDCQSHLASMHGTQIEMGPCAVIRAGGVRVLLTSRKTPPFDLGQLRSQGIVPEELSVIGVKAAVAHRRAYDKIVKASFTVGTPGPCCSDLRKFPYRHVRRPIYPLDEIEAAG